MGTERYKGRQRPCDLERIPGAQGRRRGAMRLFAAPFTHPAGVARRPLHEAARSAYASTLGDARREEKKRLRRADVARRARAEAEGLGQACLAATSGAQPGFPQGGGTKAEGTGNKGWGLRRPWHPGSRVRSGGVKAPQGTQVPRRPADPLEEVSPRSVGGVGRASYMRKDRRHTKTSTTITLTPPP